MELIREIYRGIILNSGIMENVEKTVMYEINKITTAQKATMTLEEYEKYRDILLNISTLAQEESFIAGFQYGITMLTENFIHRDTKES